MANILATGISYARHLVAFDEAAKQRLEGIDLTPLLMYIIDTTDAEALPFLAEQFHVLGWEGWALTTSEQDQRDLIKRAIELHRYKGTIWAIKNALDAVGFPNAQIVEHIGFDYDGAQTYNGTNNYEGGNWATFRVKLEVPNDRPVTDTELTAIFAMINEYKNVRSHLVDVTLVVYLQDEVTGEDEIDFLVGDDQLDTITTGLYYDAGGNYSGTYSHNKGDDPATITIDDGGVITTETF